MAPNNAFKPKPLRSANHMAGRACHVLHSTTRFGLTWVLALMAEDYVLFAGILAGSMAAWLLPCVVAWVVARLSHLPNPLKFAFASAVLTYGIGVLFMLMLVPLWLAADHLAPEWAASGHATLGNAVATAGQYASYAVILFPLALMFVIPFRLKRLWSDLVGLMSANNSFKPTPRRGAA